MGESAKKPKKPPVESNLRKGGHGGGSKNESAGGMRWLLTYADMITLMLALFVILFAMGSVSHVRFEKFAKLVSGGFKNPAPTQAVVLSGFDGQQIYSAPEDIPSIQRDLEAYVKKHHLENQVRIRMEHRGLVVTLLSDRSYYDSGSAELRPQTKEILDEVDIFLKRNDDLIRVEGNTDDVPIATERYPSNWELSTARAVNVVRYLVEHDALDAGRVSAAGYGQYHPRTDNGTEASRQINRRVDIVLLNDQISRAERGTSP